MAKRGIVYILTNPCLDGWVKIGMTERNSIEKRLHELNSPANIPLSYRCYATYTVDNPLAVEKEIHNIIDKVDDSLHAKEKLSNGRIREREFFKISPEKAYGIFKSIARLRGDLDQLQPYEPTQEEAEEQEIAEARKPRKACTFAELGIERGSQVNFLYDDSITAEVVDTKNTLLYEGEKYSVSALAKKLLREKRGWNESSAVNGWLFFTYDGDVLTDLRDAQDAGLEEEGEE